MKRIVFILMVIFAGVMSGQEIKWMTFSQAIEAQKRNPKKILLNIQTPWCDTCKTMDSTTLSNKDVVEYINNKFYAVKFNGEGDEEIKFQNKVFRNEKYNHANKGERNSAHTLTMAFGVRAYPTILVLDEKSTPTIPIEGLKSVREFEPRIKFIGENLYISGRTKEDMQEYVKNFKGKFKS